MSKLTDYSKFDHLTEEDSDDDTVNENDEIVTTASTASTAAAAPSPTSPVQQKVNKNNNNNDANKGGAIRRDETSGRYRFEYNGQTVYEFEQSLDDVTIYVLPPPYVTKGRQINCIISANHFKLGLVGHGGGGDGNNDQQQQQQQCQWFLNEDTYGTVDVDESTWTLEDCDDDNRRKVIIVTMTKANRGTVWEAALKGNPNSGATSTTTTSNTMDPVSKEQVKKDLMLQRFQEENPGFDFSGADFNGSIPDARDFMGGVKYQ